MSRWTYRTVYSYSTLPGMCLLKLACPPSRPFRCRNSRVCVRTELVCNGVNDCGDNSDEEECVVDSRVRACGKAEFSCSNGRCIPVELQCDLFDDCGDGGSDERDCKQFSVADDCRGQTLLCGDDAFCNHTAAHPVCECRAGFRRDQRSKKCEEVNECLTFGVCSQYCANTKGSYRCTCDRNFKEFDGECITKGPEDQVLYVANDTEIHSFVYPFNQSHGHVQLARLADNARIVGMDALFHLHKFVWATQFNPGGIFYRELGDRTPSRGSSGTICPDFRRPRDISADWVTGALYWTDHSRMHWFSYYTAHWSSSALLLLYQRMMYWTVIGDHSHIEEAAMDGSLRRVLLEKNLRRPTGVHSLFPYGRYGLAIDYYGERLYWADSELSVIGSIRLDGSDAQLAVRPHHVDSWQLYEIPAPAKLLAAFLPTCFVGPSQRSGLAKRSCQASRWKAESDKGSFPRGLGNFRKGGQTEACSRIVPPRLRLCERPSQENVERPVSVRKQLSSDSVQAKIQQRGRSSSRGVEDPAEG
ncbi:hypothetical protein NFI96_004206 [Prochilodus magdalenae]|nr:hypothetical protein NFI96_004206 [Prochilodus magdalenae]